MASLSPLSFSSNVSLCFLPLNPYPHIGGGCGSHSPCLGKLKGSIETQPGEVVYSKAHHRSATEQPETGLLIPSTRPFTFPSHPNPTGLTVKKKTTTHL